MSGGHKPQAECWSCKVVGSAALFGGGVYFLIQTRNPRRPLTNFQARVLAYPMFIMAAYNWMRPEIESQREQQQHDQVDAIVAAQKARENNKTSTSSSSSSSSSSSER